MAEIQLADGRKIGDYIRPYIVAEVNSSHNGNVETAKQMIDEAKRIGCDCVKFQSWSAGSLYSATYYQENPIAKRIVGKFAMSEEALAELAEYCQKKGIAFSSTPYCKREVDFLVDTCNVPFFKIASMDINNYPYIRYIAEKGVPIVLATGMADLEEIQKAVATVEDTGNKNLCLLHCISIYPPETQTIHLNNILGLREEFASYPIGFSDHSLGTEMPVAATALGTAYIEKHFTLDKKKMGMDNNMAMEPDEFENMVACCHRVFDAMGGYERTVGEAELAQREKMRRSVVVVKDMKMGSVLQKNDLDVKRPGSGIPPEKMPELIGKKLAADVMADQILTEEMICEKEE